MLCYIYIPDTRGMCFSGMLNLGDKCCLIIFVKRVTNLLFPWKCWTLFGLQVARLFNEAAQMFPEDADVHIVLGVLYNLTREYDKAIASFKTALKLKPRDYSLWNKLGATQANSVQSADAILAYQQVVLFPFFFLEIVPSCLETVHHMNEIPFML